MSALRSQIPSFEKQVTMSNYEPTADEQQFVRQGVRRYVRKSIVFFLILPHLLFWPAGSWTWFNGWLLMGFWLINTVVTLALLLPIPSDFRKVIEGHTQRQLCHQGTGLLNLDAR